MRFVTKIICVCVCIFLGVGLKPNKNEKAKKNTGNNSNTNNAEKALNSKAIIQIEQIKQRREEELRKK